MNKQTANRQTPSVFLLWHTHRVDGNDDDKLLGIYSSKANAEAAQARAQLRPGFREAPGGFCIAEYEVDRDEWTEGFVTIDGDQ